MTRMPGYSLSARCDAVPAAEQPSKEAQSCGRTWYFSKAEIEDQSPSRMDGIDSMQESLIRDLYYSFLRDLATKLEVGPVTVATASMLCHRFFMRQSLAKNDWQVIATSSMFLACEIEEDLHVLKNLVAVSYEIMYKWDPSASQRIRNRDFLSKQRELIQDGERLILVTVAFDINIEHPYKPLTSALKMLKLSENHVAKTAWDFVNYALRTTLCLRYKPPYLAAASLFLAAKMKNVKLPMGGENVWWLKFDVSPRRLQEAVRDMQALLNKKKVQKTSTPRHSKVKTPISEPKNSAALSSQPCIASGSSGTTTTTRANPASESTVTRNGSADTCDLPSLTRDSDPGYTQGSEYPSTQCSSASSGVEDSESACCTSAKDSKPENGKLDIARLKEAFKRTRSKRDTKITDLRAAENDENGDAWVARELERGVDQECGLIPKRRKIY